VLHWVPAAVAKNLAAHPGSFGAVQTKSFLFFPSVTLLKHQFAAYDSIF
jgi:hypothetical protein